MRTLTLIVCLVMATSGQAQVLKIKSGMSVADVRGLFDSSIYVDSLSFETDPEGRPLLHSMHFTPVSLEGIDGDLSVDFDGRRKVTGCNWNRGPEWLSVIRKKFISDPRVAAINPDGKIAQFDRLLKIAQGKYGKGVSKSTSTELMHVWPDPKRDIWLDLVNGELRLADLKRRGKRRW